MTATLVGGPMQVADGVGPQPEGRFLTSTLGRGMLGTMGLVCMVIRPCARAKSVRGARDLMVAPLADVSCCLSFLPRRPDEFGTLDGRAAHAAAEH